MESLQESNNKMDQKLPYEEQVFNQYQHEQQLLPARAIHQATPISEVSLSKVSRKPLVTLLALVVTLLLSVGIGANLWSYIGNQQYPIIPVTLWAPQIEETSSPSRSNPHVQATPTKAKEETNDNRNKSP